MELVLPESESVEERLRSMALSSTILRNAVVAGEAARADCTLLDPVCAAGFEAWRLTTRTLREQLLPRWRAVNEKNLPLVVEPVLGIAIAVAAGDTATGLEEMQPTTKYPKGPVTERYIRVNRRQMPLFGEEEPMFVPTPTDAERYTWILLVYSTPRVVRCEVSLPAEIDEDGYIVKWQERLILEPIILDEAAPVDEEPDGGDDIDVPVSRR